MVHCVIFSTIFVSIISRGHFYFHGKNAGFSPVGFALNFHGNNFFHGLFQRFFHGKDLVFTGSKPIFFTGYKKFFAGKKTLGSTTGILYFEIVQWIINL